MTHLKWLVLVGFGVIGFSLSARAADDAAKPAAAEKEAGLIASWKFDEGEGTTAKDSAGKNHGKIVNAKWVDGRVGKALDFNGQDSLVEVPNAPALSLTKAVSIEAWVKHRGTTSMPWEAILTKGDSAYRLHLDEVDQSFGLGLNGVGEWWNLQSGVKPDPDKWYFVVATFDGKQACLYVDGKQAAATKECPSEIMTNGYGINIGENNEVPGRHFNGTIDEVKIYDRALSPKEVAEHFKRAK